MFFVSDQLASCATIMYSEIIGDEVSKNSIIYFPNKCLRSLDKTDFSLL